MKTIRISTELHQELKSKAAKAGVSLPTYSEQIITWGLLREIIKQKTQ